MTIENPATRGAASREGRLPTPFKDGVSTRNLSSYRSFVEKEKAAVRKKAESDGTFMKAPNGKDTNLTEDQWLSVRTEAFKSWFGDWEHDPENASKVVDENGEPLVVYHGSPHVLPCLTWSVPERILTGAGRMEGCCFFFPAGDGGRCAS